MVAGLTNVVGLAGAACFAGLSGLLVASAAPRPAVTLTARADSGTRIAAIATAVVMIVMAIGALPTHWSAGVARSALFQATATGGPARDSLLAVARHEAWWAAARTPGEDRLWRMASDAALAEGHDTGAEETARRAIALVPQRAANLERLGSALALRGQADAADSAFDAARRLAPADGRVMISEARAALVLNRPDRALAVARRISALYPDAAVGHSLQGAALISLGRRDEARAELRRAVTSRWEPGLDSQRPAVLATLAALDRADSLRTWEQADSISRVSPPVSR
jgi:tetratricopeptide (TPR) repeat protein